MKINGIGLIQIYWVITPKITMLYVDTVDCIHLHTNHNIKLLIITYHRTKMNEWLMIVELKTTTWMEYPHRATFNLLKLSSRVTAM